MRPSAMFAGGVRPHSSRGVVQTACTAPLHRLAPRLRNRLRRRYPRPLHHPVLSGSITGMVEFRRGRKVALGARRGVSA